jgi:HEAT repeat protein
MINKIQVAVGIVVISTVCGIARVSWGQQQSQKPSVAALLEQLKSEQEPVRAKAFEKLSADQDDLQNPDVRTALLDLLDQENHELDRQLLEAEKKGYPDEGDNSAYAEYYSNLVDVVASFADWNDPRQACILVDASSSDDSEFGAKIADHANTTIPCLLRRSASAVSMNRAVTVPILVQALAKAKGAINPGTAQSANQVILRALSDPDEGVRALTVHSIGKFGTQEMIVPLRKVAETDPGPEVQGHSVRKAAADAIAAIEKRAGKTQ